MSRLRNLLENQKGMELDKFIDKFSDKLKHTRVLYVIQPNMEKGEVAKFGIAGNKTGYALNRLNEYVINYGKRDPDNDCRGCMIYYCGITEYNRQVDETRTQVFRIELKLKRLVKAETATLAGRGNERINTTKVSIKELINTIENMNTDLQEVPLDEASRPQTRKTTQKYRSHTGSYIDSLKKEKAEKRDEQKRKDQSLIQPTDEILEVISHRRDGKNGKTIYKLRWNRSYNYGDVTSDMSEEKMAKIRSWRDKKQISKAQFEQFEQMIEEYQFAKRPQAKFYD
jgi:hypothetical protein